MAGKAKAKAKTPAARKTATTVRIIPASAGEPARADVPLSGLSLDVEQLAAAIEAALARRASDASGAHADSANATPVLHPAAVQAMLAALCKVYSAHVEAGEHYDAFSHANPVTPTDVMVTASGLLKAANLAVFELGMWQSWTGR